MRRLWILLALAACGDNVKPQATEDAGVQKLAPCLEQPTDLPMPPTGQLTCDLLPPGFVAQ
jgi:hypothetical protein